MTLRESHLVWGKMTLFNHSILDIHNHYITAWEKYICAWTTAMSTMNYMFQSTDFEWLFTDSWHTQEKPNFSELPQNFCFLPREKAAGSICMGPHSQAWVITTMYRWPVAFPIYPSSYCPNNPSSDMWVDSVPFTIGCDVFELELPEFECSSSCSSSSILWAPACRCICCLIASSYDISYHTVPLPMIDLLCRSVSLSCLLFSEFLGSPQ